MAKEPRSSKLSDWLAFDRRQDVEDEYGNYQSTFVEQFQEPAEIIPLKGGERVMGDRLTGIQPVIIRVRYSNTTRQVGSDWQARDLREGIVYAIQSPPADMGPVKRQYLDLVASSGVAS